MALMTTALVLFGGQGDSVEYVTPNHSALMPEKVLQKRRVPRQGQVVASDTITVVKFMTDSAGTRLQESIRVSVTVDRPVTGQSADVDAALAIARDIIASDEFTNVVNTQERLK